MGQNTSNVASAPTAVIRRMTAKSTYTKDQLEKFKSKRKEIAREIYETEVSYVSQLTCLLEMYVNPLTQRRILQPKHLQRVFTLQYSEVILNFQKPFLEALANKVSNWNDSQGIGDLFIHHADGLKVYTTYIINYADTLSTISELRQTNADFNHFLQEQRSQHPQRLDLFDLLITPIQRIPRYQLLLQDLVKNTPDFHPDFHNLNFALEKIQEINVFINEEQKTAERLQHFINFQAEWTGKYEQIVIDGRKLMYEGKIRIVFGKKQKLKTFWYFFFNDLLVLVAPEKGMGSVLSRGKSVIFSKGTNVEKGAWRLHETAPLDQIKIKSRKDTEEIPYSFEIITKQDKYVASLSSSEEKAEWLQNFHQLQEQLKEGRPKKKKGKHKEILYKIFGTKVSIHKANKNREKIDRDDIIDLPPTVQNVNKDTISIAFIDVEEQQQDGKDIYVVYVMRVEKGNDHWIVKHRFNEFKKLDDKFKSAFPKKSEALKMPPKAVVGNLKKELIQERRQKLQEYINLVLSDSDLLNFPIFQKFIELEKHATAEPQRPPEQQHSEQQQSQKQEEPEKKRGFFSAKTASQIFSSLHGSSGSAPNSPSVSRPQSQAISNPQPSSDPGTPSTSRPTSQVQTTQSSNNSQQSGTSPASRPTSQMQTAQSSTNLQQSGATPAYRPPSQMETARASTNLSTHAPPQKSIPPPPSKTVPASPQQQQQQAPATQEPPTSEWQQYFTDDGYPYYYNVRTGESHWA